MTGHISFTDLLIDWTYCPVYKNQYLEAKDLTGSREAVKKILKFY
jgi:hypothetical protein